MDKKKSQILPEYAVAIQNGIKTADNLFPEAKYVIRKLEIGNAGLYDEADGTRLGKCLHCYDGFSEIYLSKTILSEHHPLRDMDDEIGASIVHEYAHSTSTIYAYNSNPLRMYLSLLIRNQLDLESRYIEEFYEKHKDKFFAKHIAFKRLGEDVPAELIPEAFESVYLNDRYSDEAQEITEDYQNTLNKKTVIPFRFFVILLHIRNITETVLMIPTALFLAFSSLICVSVMFSIFKSLMEVISEKILI